MVTKPTRNSENLSDRSDFVARLQLCADRVGNVAGLARSSNISPAAIFDYLSGKSDPSRERVIRIAKAASVPVLWLITGEGSVPSQQGLNEPGGRGFKHAPSQVPVSSVSQDSTSANEGGGRFPVMSVEASAGNGAAVMKEEVSEYMSLSPALVRALRLNPSESFVIFARGESMEPMIRGGEPLLCSWAERHINAYEGVYVVRLEGDILVKNLQRLPGGKVRVFSENASYSSFEVTLNDGTDFAILGKVLHTLRQV